MIGISRVLKWCTMSELEQSASFLIVRRPIPGMLSGFRCGRCLKSSPDQEGKPPHALLTMTGVLKRHTTQTDFAPRISWLPVDENALLIHTAWLERTSPAHL